MARARQVRPSFRLTPANVGPVTELCRLLDVLVDRLDGREILLVLDNFEQVIDAAPDLSRLLDGCPRLTVVVTSRTVLGLRG